MRHHDGYGTQAFDFGIYDQGLWLMSRFKRPFVTIMGRHLFGDHTSFILLPLVPVYWILPSAKVLLFVQAAALGRRRCRCSSWPGRSSAPSAWPPSWPSSTCSTRRSAFINLEQFHPDVFESAHPVRPVVHGPASDGSASSSASPWCLLVKEDVALLTLAPRASTWRSATTGGSGVITCADVAG